MNKLTAILDKSLFQRICDPAEKTEHYMELLQTKYLLIAPLVLHEEILVNLIQAPAGNPPAAIPKMVEHLKKIQPHWMEDVLEISYLEIVAEKSLDLIPWLSEEFQKMIFDANPDDPKLVAWLAKRRHNKDEQLAKRIAWQNDKIPPGSFFVERDEKTFFQKLTNYFLRELNQPESKLELLETFFGDTFAQYHPENKNGIKETLSKLDNCNINDRKFSRNYLIISLIYLIAPIAKLLTKPSGKQEPVKILKRQGQGNNFEDQEYVVSAFLCDRLLTGDFEMAKVMQMFQANGLWPGQVIWIDRDKDLAQQIPDLLV